MENVKELVLQSIKSLKKTNISSADFSRPHYPVCIFYYGTRTAEYHPELLSDITSGWGGNADYILFYTVEDPGFNSVIDTKTGQKLSVEDIQTQITDLLSLQNVFADMSKLSLYCLVDTTEIRSGEEFVKWYRMINHISEIVGVSSLTMLMVILNESLQFNNTAKSIKNALRDAYNSSEIGTAERHLYDSVFVLGNRLKNGSFIKIDPRENEYANFNLFADIVLLSNTESADYNNRRMHLYGNEKPAITAAYGFVQKPMMEIAMIALRIILQQLKQTMVVQSLDVETLMKALKIQNGRCALYDQYYAEIRNKLPGQDFLKWLPNAAESASTVSFTQLNQDTLGCLRQFVTTNHLKITREELLQRKGEISKEAFNLLSAALPASQLNNGIPTEIRDAALDKAEIALNDPEQLPAPHAIEGMVKKTIAKEMREILDEVISRAVKQAQKCIGDFQQIISELERMFAVGEEGTKGNLTSFYSNIIQRYYSDANKRNMLLHRILNIENDKSTMLQLLHAELVQLFESDPVFKLSFSEELIERLGAVDTERRAQFFIGQELIKNLSERIGYYSKNVFKERKFEAYLLNTEGSHNNLLYKYLSERAIPPEVTRTFFNTCNNDMAESIWFYTCSVDNLTL